MDIAKIDKNFKIETIITEPDIVWQAACDVADIYGAVSCDPYLRMPKETAQTVNPGVSGLCANTAGVRARFVTDSPYIAIHAEWGWCGALNRMPLSGSSGFDMYLCKDGVQKYVHTFAPPMDPQKGYDSLYRADGELHEYIINFPLYNNVDRLYIGVKEDSRLSRGGKYSNALPVVFYGSSITMGGCASRPGMCYQNILSRALDMDYINLGFSGNAKGESTIAEYIAGLEMSVFVCDYDHNAPDAAHLEATHYPLYETVRKKHPNLPYVIVTRPDFHDWDAPSRAVCFDTYRRALEAGDENVYFIDGAGFFTGPEADGCTVDGCHPNDLGFYRMAQGMLPTLKKVLK